MCVFFSVGWPGADRLSRRLSGSTIGAGVFHGRVRDGIGCFNSAIGTRPPNRKSSGGEEWLVECEVGFGAACGVPFGGTAVVGWMSLSGD